MIRLKEKLDALHVSRMLILAFRIVLAALILIVTGVPVASEQNPPGTTLVIFADRPLPEGFWPALTSALREELVSGSPELQPILNSSSGEEVPMVQDLQIIRGEEIVPGIVIDKSITVRMHGECLATSPLRFGLTEQANAPVPLGWVRNQNGRIEPFIHVDCSSIAQMLSQQALGRSLDNRNKLMATAVSRVLLHEWLHIATQSAHHARHGIAQPQFSVADLIARPSPSTKHQANKAQRTVAPLTSAGAIPQAGR